MRRLGPIVLASVLLALVGLGLHKAEHGGSPNETPCVLCVAADHLAGTPAHSIERALLLVHDERIETADQPNPAVDSPAAYDSRAPPAHS